MAYDLRNYRLTHSAKGLMMHLVAPLKWAIATLTVLLIVIPGIGRSSSRHSEVNEMKEQSGSTGRYDLTPWTDEQVTERCRELTPEQIKVTQRGGTEPPFCGGELGEKGLGIYNCIVCDLPLFRSVTKFDSGTGWPSFHTAFDPKHVGERDDLSGGMERTEIFCARCDAHLGHVFKDGPRPTGLRYCLNSISLQFRMTASESSTSDSEAGAHLETAYFAGGCFWGVEDAFARIPGVSDAVSGYQNGDTSDPGYQEVCTGETGHAEAVMVVFDPAQVSYRQLVEFFFGVHDPTTVDRQGPDHGTQYRSAIHTVSADQQQIARDVIDEMTRKNAFPGREIVTVVETAGHFYRAEEYHQNYHRKHGGSCGIK
jgi:peptide methionine sulfoxide reductase msrA/msrB